ncbi:MAG: hypothetical protein ACTSYD_07290 [Candidatus Heimdallarchaeaceae archaeon]
MDKEEIITPYLSEEVELKKADPFHVLIAQLKINAWQWFAHHPTCSRYKNHYFTIGKVHLCVGCTSVYSVFTVFLIFFAIYRDFFVQNFILLPLLFLYGVIISLLHLIIKPENKAVKSFSRASLGLGGGAYVAMTIIAPQWYLKLALAIIAFMMVMLYARLRQGANLELCETCPMKFHDPPCDPIANTERKMQKLNAIIDIEIAKLKRYSHNQPQPEKKFEHDVQEITQEG